MAAEEFRSFLQVARIPDCPRRAKGQLRIPGKGIINLCSLHLSQVRLIRMGLSLPKIEVYTL